MMANAYVAIVVAKDSEVDTGINVGGATIDVGSDVSIDVVGATIDVVSIDFVGATIGVASIDFVGATIDVGSDGSIDVMGATIDVGGNGVFGTDWETRRSVELFVGTESVSSFPTPVNVYHNIVCVNN